MDKRALLELGQEGGTVKPVAPAPDVAKPVDASGDALLDSVIAMIEAGTLPQAIARSNEVGVRSDPKVAARWKLFRELLGIADELETTLVVPMARAIARDDLRGVSASFHAYRKRSRANGEKARLLIARRAKSVFDAIRTYPPIDVARRNKLYAAIGFGILGAMVLTVKISRITGNLDDTPAQAHRPSPDDRYVRSREAIDDIARTAVHLEETGTPADLANAVIDAAAHRDCNALRRTFAAADAASPMTDPIIAIHKRLDDACNVSP